jgi:iron complex transport system substrate-binding protein
VTYATIFVLPGLSQRPGFLYFVKKDYMNSSIRTLLIAMVATGALSACGSAPTSQASAIPVVASVVPSAGATAAATGAAPTAATISSPIAAPTAALEATVSADHLTITDSLSRSASLSTPPRRIVSLAPSVTEILFAVGAGPQVVGDTKYCNYPPEADALPEIGGFSAKTISIEAIVDLAPDLVIAGTASQRSVVEALEKLSIPVIVSAPESIDAVYRSIEQIGLVTGHAQDAASVVANMRARMGAVTAKIATVPADQRPAVFWEVFDEPLTTAGPHTLIGQLIERAGATNVFADTSEDYPQVGAEVVVDRDPTVILGATTQRAKLTPEQIAQRSGWANIAAVRDRRVYLLDSDIMSRPGPRLADALEALAKVLYPEQFQ